MKKNEKIEKIINNIIEIQPMLFDDPNGGYEYSCPFCGIDKTVSADQYVSMVDINHDKDCTWVLAMELINEL